LNLICTFRDCATFDILFVMESSMPKTFFPFNHKKEAMHV